MNQKIDELTLEIYNKNIRVFAGVEQIRRMLINMKISASRLECDEGKVMIALAESLEDIIKSITKNTENIKEMVKYIAEENRNG